MQSTIMSDTCKLLDKHFTSGNVKNTVISNAHVSYTTLYDSDASRACRDVVMDITLSLTIPDELVSCWVI